MLAFRGLERVPVDQAEAGDIVAIAGMSEATVADTLCDPSVETPLPAQPVDPPTLSMTFRINDGPFAGQEGDKVQSRVIRDRLLKEAERNVAIKVTDLRRQGRLRRRRPRRIAARHSDREHAPRGLRADRLAAQGRLSRPTRTAPELEPIEEVIIDVDEGITGVVVQKLAERKGELLEMRPSGGGRQRLVFHVPTRGLLGYQSELLSDTRGTAVMNQLFHGYAPFKGEIAGAPHGRADLERRRRGDGLRDLQSAGPRAVHDRRRRRASTRA